MPQDDAPKHRDDKRPQEPPDPGPATELINPEPHPDTEPEEDPSPLRGPGPA
jgi:hypothetical protein